MELNALIQSQLWLISNKKVLIISKNPTLVLTWGFFIKQFSNLERFNLLDKIRHVDQTVTYVVTEFVRPR